MDYARFDPITGDLTIQNRPPGAFDEGCIFWEVPPGTDPNILYLKDGDLKFIPPRPQGHHWHFDRVSEAWIDPRTPADLEAELVGARLAAIAAINAAAGQIRRLYVTDIPGQEALYLMKEAEARAWVASADPDPMQFPLISAEVGITATTADEVAQVYLNLAGIYTAAAAQLETVRLGHIALAEVAPTVEAAEAAAQAFRDLVA
ncbi:hypothetical protein [Paracoccus sp. ME4]|uniref:hypothetical protein n=1 Tax=Paracoccus sp. ME4 TaxID=3138066 RepID=UPI00398BBAD4